MSYILISRSEAEKVKDKAGFGQNAHPVLDKEGVKKYGEGAFFVEEEWYKKVLPALSKRYRHLGYYNDIPDIMALSQKTASEIVNHYKSGLGAFHTDTAHEEDTDLVPADEVEAITHNIVRFTPDGRYAVSDTSSPSWKLEHADCENEDSNAFIDIYELIE